MLTVLLSIWLNMMMAIMVRCLVLMMVLVVTMMNWNRYRYRHGIGSRVPSTSRDNDGTRLFSQTAIGI